MSIFLERFPRLIVYELMIRAKRIFISKGMAARIEGKPDDDVTEKMSDKNYYTDSDMMKVSDANRSDDKRGFAKTLNFRRCSYPFIQFPLSV